MTRASASWRQAERVGADASVLDLGGYQVGAFGAEANGVIEGLGRLFADWHAGFFAGPRDEELRIGGIVRGVSQRRAIIDESTRKVTGYEPALGVPSTATPFSFFSTIHIQLNLEVGIDS